MAEREILFRGKRKDNGEWVEGYLVNCDERLFILPVTQVNCWYFGFLKKGEYIFGKFVEVIPETFGQFTGLTDKNGKRIFEGDILTIENEGIYAAIKYNESNAAFYVEDEDHEDYLGEAWETDVVIIGNIHDNPELLPKI